MKDIQSTIRKTDRLCVSVSIGKRVLAAGLLTGVADFTELVAHVRKTVAPASGLAELTVENLTIGRKFSRPLRLYPPSPRPIYRMESVARKSHFPWQL
ncbi:MAG: hypothetical protein HDS82_06400 [Bacteroidales bacterium]|nr:hypothetical protein [Bacteroidales bacterium]